MSWGCRFGDSEIRLNFCKGVGPLRNGRQPIFATIFLPEFISDQAVRLAFSNFEDVVPVFKGRQKFNRGIRSAKSNVKIFPAWGDLAMLPRKFFYMLASKGMWFSRKRWCSAIGAKIGTCLARMTLWIHPLHNILACLLLSEVVLFHWI